MATSKACKTRGHVRHQDVGHEDKLDTGYVRHEDTRKTRRHVEHAI